MTKLYFVRHGETLSNEQGLFMGTLDVPLSRKGIEQALSLKDQLRLISFDAVYSSPLLRAYHTAIIALGYAAPLFEGESYTLSYEVPLEHTLPFPVHIDVRLQERSFGELQGYAKAGYTERFPHYAGRNVTKSFEDKPLGGESFSETQQRIATFLDDVVDRHPSDSFVIFTHNGPLRVAQRHLLNLTEEQCLALDNPHCELLSFHL